MVKFEVKVGESVSHGKSLKNPAVLAFFPWRLIVKSCNWTSKLILLTKSRKFLNLIDVLRAWHSAINKYKSGTPTWQQEGQPLIDKATIYTDHQARMVPRGYRAQFSNIYETRLGFCRSTPKRRREHWPNGPDVCHGSERSGRYDGRPFQRKSPEYSEQLTHEGRPTLTFYQLSLSSTCSCLSHDAFEAYTRRSPYWFWGKWSVVVVQVEIRELFGGWTVIIF